MEKTFNNYVVNDSNKEAYELAYKIAKEETEDINPLFIYGSKGSGKTHLLHAIFDLYSRTSNGYSTLMSGEAFSNLLIRYFFNSEKTLEEMKNISLIMVDDIDKVDDVCDGEMISLTIDGLSKAGKKLCLTSTLPPIELKKHHLNGLMSDVKFVEVKSPTFDEQKSFYKYLFKKENINIHDEDVFEYLCKKPKDYRTIICEVLKIKYELVFHNKETASLTKEAIKKNLGDK